MSLKTYSINVKHIKSSDSMRYSEQEVVFGGNYQPRNIIIELGIKQPIRKMTSYGYWRMNRSHLLNYTLTAQGGILISINQENK